MSPGTRQQHAKRKAEEAPRAQDVRRYHILRPTPPFIALRMSSSNFAPYASLSLHPSPSSGTCNESITKFLFESGSAFSVPYGKRETYQGCDCELREPIKSIQRSTLS